MKIFDKILPAVTALLLFTACKPAWHTEQGMVFGTYYGVQYQASASFRTEIEAAFDEINRSLSTFDSASVISHINRGEGCLATDSLFRVVYAKACEVSEATQGAFDITVAPLVNAWGFGYDPSSEHGPAVIDSIRGFVGYGKVRLNGQLLCKDDARVKLDCSAIAKGYACDRVAEVLERHGVDNYLIDIGGELRLAGRKEQGKLWSIGINRAVDDSAQTNYEVQRVVNLSDCGVATSGNYRQFYQEGDRRVSHTIDPRTGYPTRHRLLSATVVAPDCMTADAYATACMVVGDTAVLRSYAETAGLQIFAIYADSCGRHCEWSSSPLFR